MDSIGETLRAARQQKKVTLEEVARTTKVKLDILEKIEAEDFKSMIAPMYTKGFIKIYAEYLGLDSAAFVDAYLKSQGGLRRDGLHIETEANIRARRPRELELSLGSVIRVVGALTVVVLVVFGLYYFLTHRKAAPVAQAKPAALPVADFDAYYQPKTKPAPELLEPPAK